MPRGGPLSSTLAEEVGRRRDRVFGLSSSPRGRACSTLSAADGECIIAEGWTTTLLILEAHASQGEAPNEEQSILLTDLRGMQVRSVLVEQGLDESNLLIISKGWLEATGPDADDQRVQFFLR